MVFNNLWHVISVISHLMFNVIITIYLLEVTWISNADTAGNDLKQQFIIKPQWTI